MNIRLDNIKKIFGETVALDGVTLEFQDGKLTTLLGPSGCGKSTMLNLISGILPTSSGSIYFGDRDVTSLSPDKRNIGLVFQNYALYPHMTVAENIAFPLEIKNVSKKDRMERADNLAKLLRIEDYLKRRPSQLSGGQQQRVAIARALAKDPDILLLDEPLSNLDARLRLEMREEIRRLQLETKITTIFVTHDQEEALAISDYILLLKSGQKQQYGFPQDLYENPTNTFVADFLGNPPINMYSATVDGEYAVFDDKITKFHIGNRFSVKNNQKIKIAIRSEAIDVFDESQNALNSIKATIENIFLNGKEILYILKIGRYSFRATLENTKTFKVGDSISVILKEKGVHIYDYKTGKNVND